MEIKNINRNLVNKTQFIVSFLIRQIKL